MGVVEDYKLECLDDNHFRYDKMMYVYVSLDEAMM